MHKHKQLIYNQPDFSLPVSGTRGLYLNFQNDLCAYACVSD